MPVTLELSVALPILEANLAENKYIESYVLNIGEFRAEKEALLLTKALALKPTLLSPRLSVLLPLPSLST